MTTYSSDYASQVDRIVALFSDTFSHSEGKNEGKLIGDLARDLMVKTPAKDISVISAFDGDVLVGAIIFSRLTFRGDPREVFILSPVAVATACQGKGVGANLLNHGLQELRTLGVEFVLTYGDPNYYARVGFKQINPNNVQPPLPLSHPEGWLGQSLTDQPMRPFEGASVCVEAMDNPDYW